MGVKISISGSTFSDDSQVLNNSRIHSSSEDVEVSLDKIQMSGNAKLLESLEIGEVTAKIQNELTKMDHDSEEYAALKKLLSQKQSGKKKFWDSIMEHVEEFTGGVLANVVVGLMKGR